MNLLQNFNSISDAESHDHSRLSLPPGLLLTTDFPPMLGGIAGYLFSVYSNFDLQDLTLIAPSCPGDWDLDSTQDYVAERFQLRNPFRGFGGLEYVLQTYSKASSALRHNPELVLHCGHIRAALAARRLKRRFGSRYLVWTYALESMDRLLAAPIRDALLEADLVLTISEYTRDFLRSRGVAEERIAKVCPATDPDRFHPRIDARDLAFSLGLQGSKVLLTIGTLNRRYRYKGQDMVIRALPQVLRHFPKVIYLIAGPGNDIMHLRRIAAECGVSNHVRLLGRVEHEQMPLLYNCCDIFLMCSREQKTLRGTSGEGFGIVFLEAGASGKPVIGGDSGGVADAVRDGVTGLLVDPCDPEAIAQNILHLLANPTLARRFGENGRRWVTQEMTWQRSAQEFWEAYQRTFHIPRA